MRESAGSSLVAFASLEGVADTACLPLLLLLFLIFFLLLLPLVVAHMVDSHDPPEDLRLVEIINGEGGAPLVLIREESEALQFPYALVSDQIHIDDLTISDGQSTVVIVVEEN